MSTTLGKGFAAKGSAPARTPVILLHDAAIDEYISSVLLTVMPGIDLLGIIIINADCLSDPAMHAASKLQQFLGRTDIPIALSRARGWNAFPWEYRSDSVNFNNIPSLQPYTAHVITPPPDGEALLTRLLEAAIAENAPLTLLMTGPMTPLITVLNANGALAKGIGQVIWMGGAIHVPGNLDPNTVPPAVANPHAEWNAFWDPYAVHEALSKLSNIHIFPLDISNSAPVSAEFMSALQAQGKQFRYSQLAFEAYSLVLQQPFYRLWDVTATCWLTRPDLYTPSTPMQLGIDTWGFEQGWIRPLLKSGGGAKTQNVFFSFANQAAFYQYVLQLLATSGNP